MGSNVEWFHSSNSTHPSPHNNDNSSISRRSLTEQVKEANADTLQQNQINQKRNQKQKQSNNNYRKFEFRGIFDVITHSAYSLMLPAGVMVQRDILLVSEW
jgi:hypothetical protein